MNNMRKNGIVGVLEYNEVWGDKDNTLHFSEWWNSEGLDFTLTSKSGKQKFSLHSFDLSSLVAIAIATDMVDIDTCKIQAQNLAKEPLELEPKNSDRYGVGDW